MKANFEGTVSTLKSKVQDFITAFGSRQTTNPNGIQGVPFSNKMINYNISYWLEPELLEYYAIGSQVHQSAQFVSSLGTTAATKKADSSEAAKELEVLYKLLMSFFSLDDNSSLNWIVERIRIGNWVSFAFDIVLWVVSLIALILAFLGTKWKKAVYGLSIFGVICMLIISIAFLYFMWGIAALSGGCNIAKEIVKGNQKVLDDIGASSDFRYIANRCFFLKDENQLTATQLKNMLTQNEISNVMIGLARYDQFLGAQAQNKPYLGIPLTLDDWKKIEDGKKPDHFDVATVLKEFNRLTECTKVQW